MVINIEKSSMEYIEFLEELKQIAKEIIPFPTVPITKGFKYLGFFLKPNCYSFQDWVWLYKKV